MAGPIDDILQTIAATPTVQLGRIVGAMDATVFAKLEQFNPSGSIKDRVAAPILDRALAEGAVRVGGIVIEATQGNSGIAMALACAVRGLSLVLVVPEGLPAEKQMLLRLYGAKLLTTPASEGMPGAVRRADELAHNTPAAFCPRMLSNPMTGEIHERTTAAEIIAAAEAQATPIDAFVACVASGATFVAIARAIRRRYPDVRCIAVDGPSGNDCEDEYQPESAPHTWLDPRDTLVPVSGAEAWAARSRLAREEGILTGLPGGSVLHVALEVARDLGPGKTVYALLGDGGDRYFSLAGSFE
ncbi:MAG: cysteine synthase family protein [Kofleriaceae bacterium]